MFPFLAEIPSLASLRADFARHALYGYVICAFFLPVMQAPPGEGDFDADKAPGADQFDEGVEMGKQAARVGDEAGDDTVADLLVEFVDRGLVGL